MQAPQVIAKSCALVMLMCGWAKDDVLTSENALAVAACHMPAPRAVSASLSFFIGTDCVGGFGEFGACSSVCADVTGQRFKFFNVVSAFGT
jgi:hypothetical protein